MAAGKLTVILGASNKPERYSYKALEMLEEYGHPVILVHPALKEIKRLPVVKSLADVKGAIDTLTLYVNPSVSTAKAQEILDLKPRRVIFNPGAENPGLRDLLRAAGIEAQDACTLVLLRTEQF